MSVTGPNIDKPPWRNRLARSAVNRKVGGSSPPGGDLFFFILSMSVKNKKKKKD